MIVFEVRRLNGGCHGLIDTGSSYTSIVVIVFVFLGMQSCRERRELL